MNIMLFKTLYPGFSPSILDLADLILPRKTGDRVNLIFFKYNSDLIELHSEKVLTISEFMPK